MTHGTRYGYRVGCRCDACKDWKRGQYLRDKHKGEEFLYVSAEGCCPRCGARLSRYRFPGEGSLCAPCRDSLTVKCADWTASKPWRAIA